MPKLLQINTCNNVYSTGKIASDIGELAIKNGWESFIVSSKNDGYAPSENYPIFVGNKADVYLHALESRLCDNSGFGHFSKQASRELISYIEKIQPDIIHLHIIHGYYLNLPILFEFIAKRNIQVVWTIHSCWEFTGHCSFFDSIQCEKWKTGCYDCQQLKEYPTSWFYDRSAKNYEEKKILFTSIDKCVLVPVSQWLGNLLKDSFLNVFPIKTIYNGIDTRKFKESSNAIDIRKKYISTGERIAIGVASTWEKRKNLKDYILLSKVVPRNWHIILVGLSDEQIKSIPDSIIGIKKTTNFQELVDLYSAADVVLNLSLEETFGLTTVEGFACGTPSIVYNKTASPELVTPETGYVVEAGDIQGVSKCLSVIDEKGKQFFSKACRERAEIYFDKDKNFMQYINLYNDLLKQNI